MSLRFVDAHLHLQDKRFSGTVDQLIARAKAAGVHRFFCNAVRESDWQVIIELARRHPEVIPFFGIHPWQAETADPGWQDRLADTLSSCTATGGGIGEIGLDKHCSAELKRQVKLFEVQLEIGASLSLPICIHCLGCWKILIDTLERQAADLPLPPVMIHSYSGSVETMERLTRMGCFISFSARMMSGTGARLLETFRQTPLQALLLETDAPDQLDPRLSDHADLITPHNEPFAVAALYHSAADQRMMHLEDFSTRIWNNATIFANKAPVR